MADIINLHWVAGYQSPITLHKLFATGKPVIWTLHDQWAFTGGCHYTAGCEKFQDDCVACPQLTDDEYDVAAAVLKDRRVHLRDVKLVVVTPSRWLASCARDSQLFQHLRVEVIPYSVETDLFFPMLKSEAKSRLGVEPQTLTLLFGAQDCREKRKGFHVLLAALRLCLSDLHFQRLVADARIRVLCLGHPPDGSMATGIPITPLGYLDSDQDVRLAYSAADVFILPSLEDNLPNTVLESMSCGTPVIASRVGGIPDVITDGMTGHLVPSGDARRLSEAILSALSDPDRLTWMGAQCRRAIEEDFTLEVQADRYTGLYEEMRQVRAPALWTPVSARGSQFAPLDSTLGSNFERIYEPVLFRALQDFAPYAYGKLQTTEADSAARSQVIEEQSRRLGQVEAELAQSTAAFAAQQTTVDELRARSGELSTRVDDLSVLVKEQENINQQLRSSWSWRVTAPLRKISSMIQKFAPGQRRSQSPVHQCPSRRATWAVSRASGL